MVELELIRLLGAEDFVVLVLAVNPEPHTYQTRALSLSSTPNLWRERILTGCHM